jgi:hypothetical protein
MQQPATAVTQLHAVRAYVALSLAQGKPQAAVWPQAVSSFRSSHIYGVL